MSQNLLNSDFYHSVDIDSFINHAADSGMDECPDMRAIYDTYLMDAFHIVEYGSGYGRVIDFLHSQKFSGKFSGIEANSTLFSYLSEKYQHQVEIIHGNCLEYNIEQSVDVVLLLWSFISEFSQQEQGKVFQHLKDALPDNAIALVDILDLQQFGHDKGVVKEIQQGGHAISLFIPSVAEIEAYCQQVGLSIVEVVNYQTNRNLRRSILVMKHG